MKTSNSRVLLSPPSLIAALRAGFDAIANHVALIIFPIALDLYLWLGPHLRLKQLIETIVSQLVALYSVQDPGAREMLQAVKELWMELAAQFNLFIALRAYPVGIPSLLASLSPLKNPTGLPVMLEIHSLANALVVWMLVVALGLVAGTLYYDVVAQAVLYGKVDWVETGKQWPKKSTRVLLLTLFWFSIFLVASIPASVMISMAALGGLILAQCVLGLYAVFLFGLFFQLIFSPHGIFVYGQKVLMSMRTSFMLVRGTWLNTTLFFLAIILLSRGLDMLWQIPPETSWLTLVGVIGHGIVSTGLLAASFIYYRDANRWLKAQSQSGTYSP
jgi:hypothetical protein